MVTASKDLQEKNKGLTEAINHFMQENYKLNKSKK
jgi:hypothetical protein